MGFGDKLKGLRDQAQQAVAENKDRIQDAVQVVGEAANSKTHGKYATKIAQVGEKVSGGVDRFAEGAAPAGGEPTAGGEPAAGAEPAAGGEPTAGEPTAEDAPTAATPVDDTPSSPPEFE